MLLLVLPRPDLAIKERRGNDDADATGSDTFREHSELISQPEPGVVFHHSLLHSVLEYPDHPQPPKCLPVTAVDRHQGNITKSDQEGVYRAHRGP
jgi:hypothetical protein